MDHYDTLGVARDASADEIKAAARREASKHHPDRGGDPNRMALVNRAKDVLLDPEKRANYDETGSETGRGSVEDAAAQMLRQLFDQAIGNTDRRMLTWIRGKLSSLQDAAIGRKSEAGLSMRVLAKRRANIKAKKGANLLHEVIDRKVAALEAAADEAEQMLRVVAEARKLLEDYESTEEQAEQRAARSPTPFDSMAYGFNLGTTFRGV